MNKPRLSSREPLLAVGLVVLTAALTFLPLVAQLGYYHDDWFTIASRISGVSLAQMHSIDRPMMGKLYTFSHALLGDAPLAWHLFGFGARLAEALAFLWLLRLLWPAQRAATTLMAVFFVVYPGFMLQPSANNYSNHFVALFLGIISLGLSVRALQIHVHTHERRVFTLAFKSLLILPSAALVLIYPRVHEALIGLEGMRFLLLGFVLARQEAAEKSLPRFLRRFALEWLPYAAALAVFAYWRLVHFQSPREATDMQVLLDKYSASPLAVLGGMLLEWGRDFFDTIFFAWGAPVYERIAQAGYGDLLLAFAVALVAVVLLWHYWRRQNTTGETDWARPAAWLGAAVVLVTLLPVALTDREVRFSYNLDRYTFQSMMGVAILLGGLIFSALQVQRRYWAAALLVFTAMAGHFCNAALYRDNWEYQRQLWWQLSWRAPQLKDGTVLSAVLPPGQRLAEGFEIWAPAGLIYAPQAGPQHIQGEVLDNNSLRQISAAEMVEHDFRTIQFTMDFHNFLLLSLPGASSCLHVVDGSQVELALNEDPLVRAAAPFSQIGRIDPYAEPAIPPALVFGKEPRRGWCYFYQKAGLARQQGDWEEAARLGDATIRSGLAAADASEWMPFLEAYANLERYDQAGEITSELRARPELRASLCAGFPLTAPPSYRSDEAFAFVRNALCEKIEDGPTD